ncbi:hypothetical protein CVT26_001019 [Gymnopilus dilepis]|uniref:Uncharacterized protein n=1 Tax=Gymnopilus dilepis TaxID=231916 RepID=A0A409Y2B5_9AGAR|nr:hypothetical protein CVT26_001019 [Gymnopilus dilepis]
MSCSHLTLRQRSTWPPLLPTRMWAETRWIGVLFAGEAGSTRLAAFNPTPPVEPPPSPSLLHSETGADVFPFLHDRFNPTSLARKSEPGNTSRRRGWDPNSAQQHTLASAEPHFPRIKERVGGGGSALVLPAGIVAATVAAAPTLSASCSQGQAGVLAGASAPRYDQTTPTTSPLRHPLAMCEFGVDACGVASWLTSHVPRLSRVGRKRLGWGLSRDGPPPYPPCLRMQAGGGVVSLSREVEA